MDEKILFAAPEAEVVCFPKQDIVTTSGETSFNPTDEWGNPTLPDDDL